MKMNQDKIYKVVAITTKSEAVIEYFPDRTEACEFAMDKNKSPYTTLYVVENCDGDRIPIAGQKRILAGLKDWWNY